ncbi:MAG TPA: TonB-dependent receptor [Steroidobacteraceae bacterium]|jgi:iron complex outermembrane receptor protein|nr:TonB-dependent receptor [Steroidobacteraceae bacterium]
MSRSSKLFVILLLLDALETVHALAPDGDQLEQVTVTAQKRAESSQDVPITITTVSADEMARANVRNLFQIADYVPGMVFSRAPDDGMALTFRGLGSPARSQAFEQSIGYFMDGNFLAKARLYASAFFDLDRAEVIKGTDSTLLGKNTSLGAINLVTRQPGTEYQADVTAAREFADGGETYDLGFDLPFTPAFAVREAIHYNDTAGWVKNTATGRSVPIDDDFASRTSAVLHPWESLTVSASYQHSDNKRLGTPYQIVDPNLDPIYGEGVLNDREDVFTGLTKTGETTHISAVNFYNFKLQWELNQYSLVSQTARVDYNINYDDDFDFSPEPWTDFIRLENYQQFTEELRLVSPTNRTVDYIVGAFLFHSNWHSVEHQDWGVPDWPPATPIAGQLFNGPFTNDFNEKTDSKSAFATATWHWADRWRLTTGLRYSNERKDTLFGRTNAAPLTIWNTLANPPFPPTALPFSDSFLDGNASLQFFPSGNEMFYLSYGHGTKTGGYVETNTNAYPVFADPAVDSLIKSEVAQTLEAGIKSTLLDRRLRINASLFHTAISNFQDTLFTGAVAGFITENLPARSKGFEFETVWQADRDLRFSAAATYADATETRTAQDAVLVPTITCHVCRATQSPNWNGTAGAEYQRAVTGSLNLLTGAHFRYRGSMYNQEGNAFPSAPYRPLDLSLGVASASGNGNWSLMAQVKNVNNSLSEDFASPSVAPNFAALASPAPLRTVWLTAAINRR